MSTLDGLALDEAGVNRDTHCIQICTSCANCLTHRQLPPLALANGLEVGRVPAELQGLTWAEQRLLAVYRISIHLIHFRNWAVPGNLTPDQIDGEFQPRCKGSAFCVPQDTLSVNKFLPPDPEQLPEHIQVIPSLSSL